MFKLEKNLEQLAVECKTDKSSKRHDYCKSYEIHFQQIRHKKMTILEIGVLEGNSLKMWKQYFSNSLIVGIDINPNCKQCEQDKIKIEIGDQTDSYFLSNLVKNYNFDIIIDDGSHKWDDLVKSFEFLFPHLKENGFYCMEDLLDCYNTNLMGSCGIHAINYLKNVVDNVNLYGEIKKSNNVRAAGMKKHILQNKKNLDFRNYIESIHFYCGLSIIKKH